MKDTSYLIIDDCKKWSHIKYQNKTDTQSIMQEQYNKSLGNQYVGVSMSLITQV